MPRFVDIEEDGLDAVFSDAGAVLDVTSALEIGEDGLHPALEGRYLLLELLE